jgi:type I restriction enzyme S subunit
MTLFDSQLPEGWVWGRLGDRYDITKKPRDLKISPEASVPFIPMEGVPARGREQPNWELRAYDAITSGVYFNRGDLLLSRITPSFENGKQALASDLPADGGYGSTELIPIHSRTPDADLRFLFYYLLHPEVRGLLVSRMEGATGRQRVPDAAVLEIPVPAPPHDEQLRISATIRLVQDGVEAEERILATMREIRQCAMTQLLTRGLHQEPQKETAIGPVPRSWEVVRIGDISRVGNGSTPKRSREDYWQGGTIPWLNSGKIHDGIITEAGQFVSRAAIQECHLPMVPAGSLLVAITGQGKTLGNVALTNIDTTINQHLAYITPCDDRVNPHFLRHYLASRYNDLRALGQGGGSTKGAITCAALRAVLVPLPGPGEQSEIAVVFGLIEEATTFHQRKGRLLADVFDAILNDLMIGRLRVVGSGPERMFERSSMTSEAAGVP